MRRTLLICDGTLFTGAPHDRPKRADILVKGDRIFRIGKKLRRAGATVLSARGACVAPGFIDAHAHSDTSAFQDTSAQGRVHDGVTTEINGMCGYSLFPLAGRTAPHRRATLRQLGIRPDWDTAAEYFAAVEAAGSAINRAFFVGHNTMRTSVTGYAARAARPGDIRRLERLLAESLEQGALGMSSGLIYPPGCFAERGEMVALCKVLARYRRPYVTHMRDEGPALMHSLRETIGFGRASGAPVHISHLKVSGRSNWWKFERMKRAVFQARKEGLDLTGDRYPYLASATGLTALFPKWLHEGGKEKALARLQSARLCARLMGDLFKRHRRGDVWDTTVVSRAPGVLAEIEGLSLRQAAARLGLDPPDALIEILLGTELRATAVFFTMSEEHLEDILTWPFISIGSDSMARALRGPTAAGKPHPRTFGTFGRFLSRYVMERKLMPLRTAIAKITSLPAGRFSLADRGVLCEGAYADLVVFKPAEFHDHATYRTPFRLSTGMRHVVVNGRPVIRNGRQTRARPGIVLRASLHR